MSPTISSGTLQLLISLPFIVVAALVGIIYFISGYKKGLWRSLVSLGVTIVSIVLSVILAKVFASGASKSVIEMLPSDMLGDLDFFSTLIMPIITNAVTVILSCVLFVVILFILLIVLKLIANRLPIDALDIDQYSPVGLRLGGMGVRALDTVLVTLMLLLPIYGTASLFSPIATVALSAADVDEPEIIETVEAVDDNFCVNFYKAGPGEWVLSSLSKTGSGTATVDIKEISHNLAEIVALYDEFLEADSNKERADALLDLAEYLEQNVVSEEWFHGLLEASVSEINTQIKTSSSKNAKELRKYKDILDADPQAVTESLISAVDVVKTAIKDEDFIEFMKDKKKDYNDLSRDFYKDVGDLLNENREIRDAKRILIEEKAEAMFIAYGNAYPSHMFPSDVKSSKARTEYAKELAEEFVDEYYDNGKVSSADEDAEGKAFMILMFETDYRKIRYAFSIHPLFGEGALREAGLIKR